MTDNDALAAQDAIDYAKINELMTDAGTAVVRQVIKDAETIIAGRGTNKQPPDDCFMYRLRDFMKESQ